MHTLFCGSAVLKMRSIFAKVNGSKVLSIWIDRLQEVYIDVEVRKVNFEGIIHCTWVLMSIKLNDIEEQM